MVYYIVFTWSDFMANGKKNYFRHSFTARNDERIQDVIEKFGPAGYYYWFALIELCAEQASCEIKKTYVFHPRILIKELRCHTNKLRVILEYLQSTRLILLDYNEKHIEVGIPNLSKYMGKYTNKIDSNTSNKTKLNKTKLNKIKITKKVSDKKNSGVLTFDFDFDLIYKNYPRKLGKLKGLEICRRTIKTQQDFEDLKKSVNNYSTYCKTENTEKKFIKHFSTFMGCWKDFIEIEIEIDQKQKIIDWIKKTDIESQGKNMFKGFVHDV